MSKADLLPVAEALSRILADASPLPAEDANIDDALGRGAPVTNRAMDVHIAALRKKLGPAASCIHTIRGVGYAFRSPERSTDNA